MSVMLPNLEALEPLDLVSGRQSFGVHFPDTAHRTFDQWLSVVVGAAIITTYVSLFVHRLLLSWLIPCRVFLRFCFTLGRRGRLGLLMGTL